MSSLHWNIIYICCPKFQDTTIPEPSAIPSAQHFQYSFNCHWGDHSLAKFIYSWFALKSNTHNENFTFQANSGPLQRPYSEDISPVIRHFQSKSSQFEARVGEADEASSRNSHCSSYLACGERLNRNRLPKGEETWGNRRLWFPWLTALLHMPELCLLWWHLQSYKIQSSQGRRGGWSIGEVTGVKKSRCWEKRPSYKKQPLEMFHRLHKVLLPGNFLSQFSSFQFKACPTFPRIHWVLKQ